MLFGYIETIMNNFENILGGFDSLLTTLIYFVIIDYITGFMLSILNKKLSSSTGFKGIFKKIVIFFIVGVAVKLDMLFQNSEIRYIVIIFYIVNEGISILENIASLGLPVPQKIKSTLEKLKEEK